MNRRRPLKSVAGEAILKLQLHVEWLSSFVDLFELQVPESDANAFFLRFRSEPCYESTRALMTRLFANLPNPDGHFVREFQTQGFDARIWELYLFALREDGLWSIDRPMPSPDYRFSRGQHHVWVEAVIASSTQRLHEPDNPDHFPEFIDHALAIRFGTPLANKLAKRYWELPHVAGQPLVIAIADFVESNVVRWGEQGLRRYLYGADYVMTSHPGEELAGRVIDVSEHRYGAKSIPSGFFSFDAAENISAVLFNNSGTVAKFHRKAFDPAMDRTYRLLRHGLCPDPRPESPLPQPFAYIVGEVEESWREGTVLLHNPNARYPIEHSFFEGTTQWWFKDGDFNVDVAEFHPFNSETTIFSAGGEVDEDFTRVLDALAEKVVERMQMTPEDLAKTYDRHRKILESE